MIITVTLNASIDKTAVIKNFTVGRINRLDKPLELAGGKGLNVTRALKTLGQESVATGFIGGKYGEKLESLMNDEGLSHDFLKINDETRFCLAIIDKELKTLTELNENGPDITIDEREAFYKKLNSLKPDAELVVISGSIPKSLPKSVYFDLINICKKRGLITVLDASGDGLAGGIDAKPYIIKPNQHEAEELMGFKINSPENWIKGINFLCNYCTIACITLENKGCVIGTKDEIYHFEPPEVNVVNSVGSGDSFLAGMIYAFINNKPISEMGLWATATGTANAMTDRAGLCYVEDIHRIFKKVKCEKIFPME